MALKMLIKKEDAPKLPKGGDRFLWNELIPAKPTPAKKLEYSKVLKFEGKREP